MNRLVIAAAIAIPVGLVSAQSASAQIVYNYTRPAPGGLVQGGVIAGPAAYHAQQTYYSPFTGMVAGRALYRNSLGQAYGRSYTYNASYGLMSQNTGFYMPGFYFNPYNLSFGLNMHPNFGMGNTYQFYGGNPFYGANPYRFYGGFYGRRW